MTEARSKYRRDAYGTTRPRKKPKGPPFVMLPRYMIRSVAWRSLSGEAIAAFVALSDVYNGVNNGQLSLPVKSHARSRGISPDTANRAIRELIEKGLIEVVRRSAFSVKNRLAAEYRLTLFKCNVSNDLPSKAFMRWQPDGPGPDNEPCRRRRPNGQAISRSDIVH
jgi:hypothetical protein